MRRRAAIYVRVSQDRAEDRLGVQRQEEACRQLAVHNDLDVVGVYSDDGVSAFSGRPRPEFDRLLSDVEAGEIDAIVAWHADRMYRSFDDLERLAKVVRAHGVAVLTVQMGSVDLSTASGQMIAEILAAVGRHESAHKGERVRAKQAQSASSGLAHGGIRPFGYRRVEGQPGVLVVDEAEAAAIREAADRVLAGESVRSISADFTARGISTVRGGFWQPKALSEILKSPRIAGLRPVDGEAVNRAQWPAILDRSVWERVRLMVSHAPVGRRPRSYLLAGLVFCGRCGCRMNSATGKHAGKTRRRYECRRDGFPGACASTSVEAGPLEDYVVGLVLAAANGGDLTALRSSRQEDEGRALTETLIADEEEIQFWTSEYTERRIDRKLYRQILLGLEPRVQETRRRLAKLAPADPLPQDIVDLSSAWQSFNFEQKRATVSIFIDRITVNPSARRRVFGPERLSVDWRI